jgi:hypothetical protein
MISKMLLRWWWLLCKSLHPYLSIYLYTYYRQKLLIVDTVGKTFWKTDVPWVSYLWVVVVECRIISFHLLQAQVLNLVSPLVASREILWCFAVVELGGHLRHTHTHSPTDPAIHPWARPFSQMPKTQLQILALSEDYRSCQRDFCNLKMQISPSTMVLDRLQFLAGFFPLPSISSIITTSWHSPNL